MPDPAPPPDKVITFAERLNALRLIPRGLIIGYYIFFANFSFYVADWFMAYDFETITDPTVALAIAGFPVGILGVMTTILGSLTNNYFRTGGNDIS